MIGSAPIYLSVVIPAYNEERRIGPTLSRVSEYLAARQYPSEVIVVDDGSRDATVQVVRRHVEGESHVRLLLNESNRGKGFAVQHGMLAACGEYGLLSDADLSTPIEEVEKFFPWVRSGFDIVIGSRDLPGSDIRIHQPWYRGRMGKIFNWFVQMILLPGFADTQCGFKMFRRSAAREIFRRQRVHGFCFDVEILWLASKQGFRIKEIPIVWYNEKQSRVHPMKDASRMLVDLMRIRIRDWRGCYSGEREWGTTVEDKHSLDLINQGKS